jgi:MATE family multidrug resistance protein
MTTFRRTTRELLSLAGPIVTVQVGLMFMGVVDTAMVGRVSAADLAAVALGSLYFFMVSIFGVGVLMALDPIVAQAIGAGEPVAVARGVQRGLLVTLVLTVWTSVWLLPGEPILALLRQPGDVVPIAAGYARALIPGMLPFFVFVVFRQSLQAMGHVRPVVYTIILGNLANVLLNWVLIFGHWGMPALGAVGSGWATSISRWLMTVGLLLGAWPRLRPTLVPIHRDAAAWPPLARLLRIGIPIGLQHQLEFGAFAVAGLLMGTLGTTQMAAHQVAINLASLTFMVPLGVGAAASVLVGRAVGRGDSDDARRAAGAALLTGSAFMATCAVIMLALPSPLASVYTANAPVLAVAATLIPLAGLFQVFDGIQVVSMGALRGLGDTRGPMLISLLGFWLVGLPVSIYLGFEAGAGPVGIWWGLVAGLAAVALLLLVRVRRRFRGHLERIMIDITDPSRTETAA